MAVDNFMSDTIPLIISSFWKCLFFTYIIKNEGHFSVLILERHNCNTRATYINEWITSFTILRSMSASLAMTITHRLPSMNRITCQTNPANQNIWLVNTNCIIYESSLLIQSSTSWSRSSREVCLHNNETTNVPTFENAKCLI